MRLATLLTFMACFALGCGLTLKDKPTESDKKDFESVGDDSLRKAGKALETVGLVLQGKSTDISKDDFESIITALNIIQDSDTALDDESSEYFWKKVKQAVSTVAKAVVVNKIVGAIG